MVDVAKILSCIDLTSLNESDSEETIAALCKKANTPLGHVAAVCVYPQFVGLVKKLLQISTMFSDIPTHSCFQERASCPRRFLPSMAATPLKQEWVETSNKIVSAIAIATVANFPRGKDSIDQVITSIKKSIHDGANEIDVVFPYTDFLQGEKETPYDFIRACKAACGENILLKVILETGALRDLKIIAEVSYNVANSGADFLKTSTGKIQEGATLEAAQVILETLKKIPRKIGLKVSGGIRTVEQAASYVELAENIMGKDWVTPKHFRIGASALLDEFID